MSVERVTATYRIESPLNVEQAAATLAGEQSSGTFVAVPGETEELKRRFAARVERVTLQETVDEPSLPGCRSGGALFRRAEVVVSWPLENFGYNLPALVSTLGGNLYELSQVSGLKLLDFDVSASFAEKFPGPRFGVAGTRRLAGVEGRPLIGTIIKPSVGLAPQETAEMVRTLVAAGIDFIKDDELMADPPHAPFDKRVDAVMRVVNDHADRTGNRVMYAFNVSDELDAMRRHYEKIVSAGGTCAMVSLNSVGLVGVKCLCDAGELAIHGHRNGWGALNRHPLLGIEFRAYQKLWRLAGVDQIHVNGIQNKFCESDDSVVRSIESCLEPMLGGYSILPVVSSGQWGGQAFETYRRTQTLDLLYLAGGGIAAHPGGPAAGVVALRQAWDAAAAGLSMDEAAARHLELRQSIERFGQVKPSSSGGARAMSDLMLTYYADDFTGATDALESLERAGIRTALFLEPPTPEQVAAIGGLQAVGVTGMTRTMTAAAIEAALCPALKALRRLGAPHVHYKVCSTFDSSPTVGSIGRAIDVGAEVFAAPFMPLVVGAPALGRYCIFGNLFARMGIGSGGAVHRLDRHPSMSRHPVTPADESDLRLHLSRQTAKQIGLFDVLSLQLPWEQARTTLQSLVADGNEVVLFDVLYADQLQVIGRLVDEHASAERPLFTVGSSGVEAALGAYWAAAGRAQPSRGWPAAGAAEPLLAASGSCSPVTTQQIAWARGHGFVTVELDAAAIGAADFKQVVDTAAGALTSNRSVVIHSGAPDGARRAVSAQALGTALGQVVREVLEQTPTRRVCIAGGDTSSFAARALGIEMLEMIAPLTPGAPLCRATAPGSSADGVEFVFKGGQVGASDYLTAVARGST